MRQRPMRLTGMRQTGRRLTRRMVVGGALAAGGLCTPMLARPAQAAQFDWVLPHAVPASAPLHKRLLEAAARIGRETDGRMAVTILPDGARGNSIGLLSQVRAGSIPLCAVATQALGAAVPAAATPSAGFAWRSPAVLWRALDGQLGSLIREQAALSLGVVLMDHAWDAAFRNLMTRDKPVRNPDDLAGMRLRVPVDSDTISMFLKLGAAPTSIPPADLTRALVTRRIDGLDGALMYFRTGRIDETQKTCSLTGHIWDGYWLCAHGKTWSALPDDLRSIAARAFDEAAVAQRQDMINLERQAHAALDADGVRFTAIDIRSFRDVLRRADYYAAWTRRVQDTVWSAVEQAAGHLT
ncbi:MAG: TRAP transporter substrate-binding protein DctP [Acetobacteraceae bacterium]|nr:TRAP transporter substrate-binding protein DctP [Acetobacteraceae bacterium]